MAKPRQRYFSAVIKPEDGSRITEEFRDIYELRNRLEVTTTAPNGSRKGIIGDIILYNSAGTFSLWVNTTSLTVWQQI